MTDDRQWRREIFGEWAGQPYQRGDVVEVEGRAAIVLEHQGENMINDTIGDVYVILVGTEKLKYIQPSNTAERDLVRLIDTHEDFASTFGAFPGGNKFGPPGIL